MHTPPSEDGRDHLIGRLFAAEDRHSYEHAEVVTEDRHAGAGVTRRKLPTASEAILTWVNLIFEQIEPLASRALRPGLPDIFKIA